MRRAATYVTLLTAGVAQPLLQLYGGNNAVFTAARINGAPVVLFAAAVIVVPPVVLMLLDAAASRAPQRTQAPARRVLVAVAALPLAMVLLRGIDAPWVLVLAASLLVAAVVAGLHGRFGAVRMWLGYASPLAVAVFSVFVVASQGVIVTADAEVVVVSSSTTVPARDATPAERVSVVWLQLDEAPLWPLLRTDGTINERRFPGFAALAESSTWYRNMLGLSQTTVDAVPAMLTGTEPVTGRAPTYWNHRRNVFSLMYGRRSLDVHEIATALCPKDACAKVSVSGNDGIASAGSNGTTPAVTQDAAVEPAPQGADWGQFLRDTWVVLGHKLLPSGLRDRLPPIDEGWGGFGAQNEVIDAPDTGDDPAPDTTVADDGTVADATAPDETFVETKRNTVTNWERGGALSQVSVAEGMIARAARSSVPTFHFAHVLLPHRPWQLTPDMRSTGAITTDKRSAEVEDRVRDEYQAFLAQYVATDRIVLDLVGSLRRSANWDRTMIIVTADHGIAFEPGESKRKDIDPTNAHTLEQIYRVPLFVKWSDQTKGSTSDCPVQGFDVLPMVMAATGLDPGWEMAGTNPEASCPSRAVRTVWWDKGETTLRTGFDAAVEEARRLDRWVDADGTVDDIARTAGFAGWFDVVVTGDAPADRAVSSWTLNQRRAFANVGTSRLERTPMQFDGTFRTRARVPAGATGLVVVDGRVVAVVPEIAGVGAGTHRYRSILVPSVMTGAAMKPELWVATGSPGAPVLTRVGAPSG
ncbi:MAG: sulfatase-like hydrolase/transferase [Acidimicrobiales bacterium]